MAIQKINSTEEFDKILANPNTKVLVDFYADWCGPCKMMAPILETVANENPDQVILEVNVDEQEELMSRYKIMSIPTLIVFENGEIVKKAIGLQPKNQLEELIK